MAQFRPVAQQPAANSPSLGERRCEIRVLFFSEWQQESTTSAGGFDTLILRSGRARALSNAKCSYPCVPSDVGVKRPGRYKLLYNSP